MADEFDPLKHTDSKPSENLYSTIQRNQINTDGDLLRPAAESVFKTQDVNNGTNVAGQQQSRSEIYNKLDFTSNASKAPTRSTNPFNNDVQKSPPPTSVIDQASQKPSSSTTAKVPKNEANRFWGQDEGAASSSNHYEPTGEGFQTGPSPGYYPEEYYEDPSYNKKKGFSATMERLVHRFPALGLFFKPSVADSSEIYEAQEGEEYVEEGEEVPELVDANQTERELTDDELALNERYSNKSRTQIIRLQNKEQTQPVDVRIHHESYTLYSCDVGRSVIEIFDINGKLQHIIDDPATIKFQPTALAVAYDGSIIVASHFNHRLQLYSPVDPQETERADQNGSLGEIKDGYYFKQYKLGSPGHDSHQFHHPAGIAIDFSDGYLYVCDRGNFRIQVMRPEGICERVIELMSQGDEQCNIAPIQIAHQSIANQIVCLVGTGDALCFLPKDADGTTHVEPLYILDSDGLGLQGASGLAVDAHDRIFISDTGHHRIIICTPEGGYITHFGIQGDGLGELKRPCGLDITNDGTIVVADSGNKRLQLFGSMREQEVEENKSPTDKKSDDKGNFLVDTGNASAL